MLMFGLFGQQVMLRNEQTSVWKPVRCRLECKRVLKFSEADGREVITCEGRAFMPLDAEAKVGGELLHDGECHRIAQVQRHECAQMGYVEVRF